MRLLERADLLAPARSDASQRVVDEVLARIADDARPMPPTPRARVGDAELAAVQAWVDQGTPPGSCADGR